MYTQNAVMTHNCVAADVMRENRIIRRTYTNTIGKAQGTANNALLNLPNDTAVGNCLGTIISVSVYLDSLIILGNLRVIVECDEGISKFVTEARE